MATEKTELQRIWAALLNGTMTPDEARLILPRLRDSSGQPIKAEGIESLLRAAAEQRASGMASGAAWAQAPVKPAETGLVSQHSRNVLAANDPANLSLLGENDPFAAFTRQR